MSRIDKIYCLVCLSAVFLLAPQKATAQVPIFFDAFLFDNAGMPGEDFNAFFQWTVTNGTVDLLGGNVPGSNDPVNGRFVDLDGGDPGLFATTMALQFLPGQFYNLSFTYQNTGAGLNMATATIGSFVFAFSTSTSALQTFSADFMFPNLTMANLVFEDAGLGSDGLGVGVDTISVTQVPETGTVSFLVLGVVALGFLGWQRYVSAG